ncbi:hypothetical protein ACCO45_006731 [Purpureocillium lilacinum]|uniref:Uncharacterized protein n=1 Tax=Purpureocillium lilacinum TaxID=33203 RepID=A0ACC4DRS6_PURLI
MSAPSAEPSSLPPPPTHYPPCPHQKDSERDLYARLRQVYQEHSPTWDDESRSAWFTSVIDKATLGDTTTRKVSAHNIARCVTAETVTWAHFCALSTIFENRFQNSKKFVKLVLARYPSADLDGLSFKESYKLPNAESTLVKDTDGEASSSDSQDDKSDQLLQSRPPSSPSPHTPPTMPVQTRSASAKPLSSVAPPPAQREPSEEEQQLQQPAAIDTTTAAPAQEPKKRKRLPGSAPKRPAVAEEETAPAPKRQKKTAKSTKSAASTSKADKKTDEKGAKKTEGKGKAKPAANSIDNNQTVATPCAASTMPANAADEPTGPKKRGRKPGTTNKPRADIAALVARVDALEAQMKELQAKNEKLEAFKANMRAYRRKQSEQILRLRRVVADTVSSYTLKMYELRCLEGLIPQLGMDRSMFPQEQKQIRRMATAAVSGEADDESAVRSTVTGSRVLRPYVPIARHKLHDTYSLRRPCVP